MGELKIQIHQKQHKTCHEKIPNCFQCKNTIFKCTVIKKPFSVENGFFKVPECVLYLNV